MHLQTFILSNDDNQLPEVEKLSTDFTIKYDTPIDLKPNKLYEAAFLSLETYNSIPNITEKNNIFKYSNDSGVTWKTIILPKDAYEVIQINDEIQRQMIINGDYDNENNTFYISISISRLSSVVEIDHLNYKVDFNVSNSIGPTLGFNRELLSKGYNKSPNIIDIMNVNSILVNVDIITGSYVNKTRNPAIHRFSPNVGPGAKIRERPSPSLIYYPVNRLQFDTIRVWLTDQDKKLIDLQGERITIRIIIRKIQSIKYSIKQSLTDLKQRNIL